MVWTGWQSHTAFSILVVSQQTLSCAKSLCIPIGLDTSCSIRFGVVFKGVRHYEKYDHRPIYQMVSGRSRLARKNQAFMS